jgi:hypothetical protein
MEIKENPCRLEAELANTSRTRAGLRAKEKARAGSAPQRAWSLCRAGCRLLDLDVVAGVNGLRTVGDKYS